MAKIESIYADWVLDSRGEPAVVAKVRLKNGIRARAIAPSGKSTGKYEAMELRDNDPNMFLGKGVQTAVNNVNTHIFNALRGMRIQEQQAIDARLRELDAKLAKKQGIGSTLYEALPNYSILGANATTAVSMACLKAAAANRRVPLYEYLGGHVLPIPFLNVINGGQHAGNKDLAIQEFMIVPIHFQCFEDALRAGVEVYQHLKKIIEQDPKYGKMGTNVGDERGFVPQIKTTREALDLLKAAIKAAGYEGRIFIAIDCAASAFYDEKTNLYHIDGDYLNSDRLLKYYVKLADDYPALLSIEDSFHDDDFKSFSKLIVQIGKSVQVVADDLTATQIKRLKQMYQSAMAQIGRSEQACMSESANNPTTLPLDADQSGDTFEYGLSSRSALAFDPTILLKVNQFGDISGAVDCVNYSQEKNWGVMVSHRSGETTDTTISDLAVGWNAGQIKSGAPAGGERIAKYNRLLQIERQLKGKSVYAGQNIPAGLPKAKIMQAMHLRN